MAKLKSVLVFLCFLKAGQISAAKNPSWRLKDCCIFSFFFKKPSPPNEQSADLLSSERTFGCDEEMVKKEPKAALAVVTASERNTSQSPDARSSTQAGGVRSIESFPSELNTPRHNIRPDNYSTSGSSDRAASSRTVSSRTASVDSVISAVNNSSSAFKRDDPDSSDVSRNSEWVEVDI